MQIYSRRSPLSATVPTISNYLVVLAAIVADALGLLDDNEDGLFRAFGEPVTPRKLRILGSCLLSQDQAFAE